MWVKLLAGQQPLDTARERGVPHKGHPTQTGERTNPLRLVAGAKSCDALALHLTLPANLTCAARRCRTATAMRGGLGRPCRPGWRCRG